MKKLKIVFVCVVIAIIGLFYYFSIDYQRIRGFYKFPENSVQAMSMNGVAWQKKRTIPRLILLIMKHYCRLYPRFNI
ncbi:hypothetical protein SAMN02745151_01036 [[Clostridium] propionicum DSM 1682]|uniref:Uncharacterized protein n=1 Tax=Anaerotignum propionicum DSM 1682 TaxID=991789 RepID=A0A0X8VDX7_ANAPI|nr:hypothetical protein CPRO_26710 [Anaerotignum propionicum DSM 1682]SHE54088.1 hypothetical protein SAMN02745151_01036 [[Clostridium] propionicum DSM 1682] [Anaerotignum propionicum DSM 1682]